MTEYVDNLDGTVTISKELFIRLLNDSSWLEILNSAGVDNWPGIEYAYEGRKDYPELTEETLETVLQKK